MSIISWLKRNRNRSRLPRYSALRAQPSRPLPETLHAREAAGEFEAGCEKIRQDLLRAPLRPAEDAPLLTAFMAPDHNGMLTIPLDGNRQCLPVFSSPLRAGDYVETLLTRGPAIQYLMSTPAQCFVMLNDLRDSGIDSITFDRCPRCNVLSIVDTSSVNSSADVITLWSIHKSREIARLELYLDFARHAAKADDMRLARDVALETVGHVTMEEPRLHLLLAKLAQRLDDRTLGRDAEAFLSYLDVPDVEDRLREPI